MSLIRHNIAPRLRLLRTALFRRFVYADVVAMAREYGLDYKDVCADIEPFGFVRSLAAGTPAAPPDFSAVIEPAETFTPPGAPPLFNSEPCVARFLGQLVFFRQARIVVELGCFAGWASAHMALALKTLGHGGRLYCVDYLQEYLDVTLANARRHGLGGIVTPVCGLSLEPSVLAALPEKIDVIFLDTSHSYPATRDEVLAYAPRLSPGGMLVLHDSVSASGVRQSVREVADRFRVLTFATEQGNGVTVLQSR
jgi:predicted O-methyltransferase YrrM